MDIQKILDRKTTSDLIIDDAKRGGVFPEYQREIEYCYFFTFYRIGIIALAKGGMLAPISLDQMKKHLRKQVPNYKRNPYLLSTPMKDLLIIGISLCAPQLFCSVVNSSLGMRRDQRKIEKLCDQL